MQWKEILNSIKSSAILLFVIMTAAVIATQAATTLYSGSFSVLSGGTITDTNQTVSSCAGYNASKQLVTITGCAFNTGTSVISYTGKISAGNFLDSGLISAQCLGTDGSGNLISNSSCAGSGGIGTFTGGIGLDNNGGPPANGIKCGVANTTSCKFLAATGTTTTSGFAFNTTTACHATTDLAVVFQVNSVTQASLGCGGLFSSTGAIVAGSGTGVGVAAGDLGASRSASTGAIQIGGSTNQATVDWNINNALALTSDVPIFSSESGGGLTGPVPPTFTASNTPAAKTEHCVEGVAAGATGNTLASWNAAQAFASPGSYSIYMADGTTGVTETTFTTYTTTSFNATTPATIAGHNYYFRVCGV